MDRNLSESHFLSKEILKNQNQIFVVSKILILILNIDF